MPHDAARRRERSQVAVHARAVRVVVNSFERLLPRDRDNRYLRAPASRGFSRLRLLKCLQILTYGILEMEQHLYLLMILNLFILTLQCPVFTMFALELAKVFRR